MTSIGTLYSYDAQPHSKRIRSVAAIAGLKIESAQDYVHYKTNKTPEFLAKFRSGKIPAFESSDGFCLFEGSAIARYIASLAPESGLLGYSPTDAALVDQWVSFVDHELASKLSMLVVTLEGRFPYSESADQALRSRVIRALKTLNSHLLENTFLLPTGQLSLADISFAAVVQGALKTILDAELRSKLPGVTKYIEKALEYAVPKGEMSSAALDPNTGSDPKAI
ncbi:elongation factor 1-gamma [Ceratobasidium sp. AG-Ba]|nr:elongation factor 1-gamma [Ceratobasidium sp. AG-Ba]QRV99508.1 elongation factor 1-gamma [Ceratobasidium sp. AG-Ba]